MVEFTEVAMASVTLELPRRLWVASREERIELTAVGISSVTSCTCDRLPLRESWKDRKNKRRGEDGRREKEG